MSAARGLDHVSLGLYSDTQYGPGLAKMDNGLGYLHGQLGDYEQALECGEQALSLYGKLGGDTLNEAATWDSIGYSRLQQGRYDEAISASHTALDTIEGSAPATTRPFGWSTSATPTTRPVSRHKPGIPGSKPRTSWRSSNTRTLTRCARGSTARCLHPRRHGC
jgi:tetratricopeptide (TPR) repeat protein